MYTSRMLPRVNGV